MQNHFPPINYLLYIVNDTHYMIDISTEHIVIVSELLKEEKIQIAKIIVLELNEIYTTMLAYMDRLDELKNSMERQGYTQALDQCLQLLKKICEVEVKLIQSLGCVEGLTLKTIHGLIISHITVEERYCLELITGYVNKVEKISLKGED